MVYTTRLFDEYAKYFSSNFLVSNEGKPLRYVTVGNGLLSYIEFSLLALGLIAIFRKNTLLLPLILLLVSPFPAALTTENAPNLHRAIFMIPFMSTISGVGLSQLKKIKPRAIYTLVIFLLIANFIYFWHMYSVHSSKHEPIPMNRNIGMKETIYKVEELKSSYDKIYITNIPDDLYPWYAFYTNVDPYIFNQKAKERAEEPIFFEKIGSSRIKCPARDIKEEYPGQKILLIDAEGCDTNPRSTSLKKIFEVKRHEGGIPYTFWSSISELSIGNNFKI